MGEKYLAINKQVYRSGIYSIVPIRFEDRYDIMNWRNEQIFHLRQAKALTKKTQDNYFEEIVNKLFEKTKPSQILFSFLENEICIGYGGLVHINWIDKNAEISFIMNTSLEQNYFEHHWSVFLSLIENVAFKELNLYKVFTYAFDIRPILFQVLEKNSYKKDSVLHNHCLIDNKFRDVIIHSKENNQYLFFRKSNIEDVDIYFKWLNDMSVRSNSFNSDFVTFQKHQEWFESKIKNQNYLFLIFKNIYNQNVGQIRIKKSGNARAIISISIDSNFRGKKYAEKILRLGVEYFFEIKPNYVIDAFIKVENIASKKAFINAGFNFKEIVEYENHKSLKMIKKNENR